MKTHLALTILIVCSLIQFNNLFSQTEIERYKQPELIEGSNLFISASPDYSNTIYNDTDKSNNFNIGMTAEFTKWRYTPKLDYSVRIRPGFSYSRSNGSGIFTLDRVNENSRGFSQIQGAADYYLFRIPVYGGSYFSSQAEFSNHHKPASNNNLSVYIGYGKLVNGGQIVFAKNFENVLKNEGIISKKLNQDVFSKLTVLLDKRYNREFMSKYKDDADIEFFSQVEQLLLDEGVIKSPLSSKTTLKLFQALTNFSFVNYPRYKGFNAQAELDYNNINFYYNSSYENIVSLILSGLYGLPLGYKTNLLFSAFISRPLNIDSNYLYKYPEFHSPYTIREGFPVYTPLTYDLPYSRSFKYTSGAEIIIFHNFSPLIGISGFVNYSFGKSASGENGFSISSFAQLRYNILSKLYFNTTMQFFRTQSVKMSFGTFVDFNYILF
jgi:hypothetical protein